MLAPPCLLQPLLLILSCASFAAQGFVLHPPTCTPIPTLLTPKRSTSSSLIKRESSLGGMFSQMLSGMLKGPVPPSADMDAFKDPAPSWTELQALLIEKQTVEERALPDLRAKGRGPPSSKAALRLFDAPDGYEPRVVLYRDTAAWCPYCQKVWMYLGTS